MFDSEIKKIIDDLEKRSDVIDREDLRRLIDDDSESLNNKDEAIPDEMNLLLVSPIKLLDAPSDKPDAGVCPKGCFTITDYDRDGDFYVNCQLHKNAKEDVPEDQKLLFEEIETANTVIKSLSDTDIKKKRKYHSKLVSLAKAGLEGETAQPKLALSALKKLEEEILMVEGQRIKNNYMINLGKIAIIISIAAFGIYLFVNNQFPTADPVFTAGAIVWIGAMLGTWVSFGARKHIMTFKELSVIEDDRMNPLMRLIYIGICSIILYLFIKIGLFNISIGEMSAKDLLGTVPGQMLIGIVCGLTESKIGISIFEKAKLNFSNDEKEVVVKQ
ncbi:hypothetical protein [Acetobacterium sp.]|uniref:hypothetical protein n=1 Tax=Acetobacterium sp. TaxID=1872094 RepID=UPI002F3E1F92